MIIRVKDQLIETKEITQISEFTREQFTNRYCGMKIELYKKDALIIEWDIPYETTMRGIIDKKETCRKLIEQIILEWEKDKIIYPPEEPDNIPTFNIR